MTVDDVVRRSDVALSSLGVVDMFGFDCECFCAASKACRVWRLQGRDVEEE